MAAIEISRLYEETSGQFGTAVSEQCSEMSVAHASGRKSWYEVGRVPGTGSGPAGPVRAAARTANAAVNL